MTRSTGPKRTPDQLLSDRRLTAQLYLREWTQEEIAAEINRRRDDERAAENKRISAENARRVADGRAPLDLLPYPATDRHITQQTVSNDVQALRKEWRARADVDVAAAVAEELAEIAALKRTYWDAWEGSRGESVKSYSERTTEEPSGLPALPDAEDVGGSPTNGRHCGRAAELAAMMASAGKVRTKATRTTTHLVGESAFLAGVQWCIERRSKLLGTDPARRLVLEGNPDKPLAVNLTDPALLKTMTDEELRVLDALHDKLAPAAAGSDPGGAAPSPL